MRICKVEGCNGKHVGRGFCRSHYQKWKYKNDPVYRKRQTQSTKIWYENNREHRNEMFRLKYATDEKFRQYHRDYCRKRNRRIQDQWSSLNDEQQLELLMEVTNEVMEIKE